MISGKRGFEPVPKLYIYFPDHALCMASKSAENIHWELETKTRLNLANKFPSV